MPGGRPTILTGELVNKAETYLGTCYATPVYTDKGTVAYTDTNLPMIVGLAIYLGIDKTTIYDWCKGDGELNKQFSNIVKEIQHEQEKMLVNKGLAGLFQPKTTGMLLSKHGYSEKTEVETTMKVDATIRNEEKDALAKEYEEKLKAKL